VSAVVAHRVVQVTPEGVVISGGSKVTTFGAKAPATGKGYTMVVENVLARMEAALAKTTIRPWQVEVTIDCPERLEWGFQRHGFKIRFPEAVYYAPAPVEEPTPAKKTRKAKKAA